MIRSVARAIARHAGIARALVWIRLAPREAAAIRARRVWLLGERLGASYGDNSAALHGYLRAHHPEIEVYWVVNRDSPDVEKARAVGPVLYRGEHATYVHTLLAHVVVMSHGLHDVPGLASRFCRAFRVNVGHGIHAFKKKNPPALWTLDRFNRVFGLVLASSAFERGIKLDWGMDPDQIAITGLPRLDRLLDRQAATPADARRILYMPTWRADAAGSADALARSGYLAGLTDLITSPDLDRVLRTHDAFLDVVFHSIVRPHAVAALRHLGGGRVRIAAEADPQDLFAHVGALVTDYSSVVWDFLYLGKPVLFYQFDRDAYEANLGPRMAGRAWPGPVSLTAADAVRQIDRHLSGELAADADVQQAVASWTQDMFAFRDAGNCARVVAAILARTGAGPHADSASIPNVADA